MDYYNYSRKLDYLKNLIERGKLNSPSQVSDKFECSERTIRRMIEHLKKTGCKIEYCRKTGRYKLNVDWWQIMSVTYNIIDFKNNY